MSEQKPYSNTVRSSQSIYYWNGHFEIMTGLEVETCCDCGFFTVEIPDELLEK